MKIELTESQVNRIAASLERQAEMSDEWYLRNRGRQTIGDMFKVIRHIQILGGFQNSEIIRIMLNIWKSQSDVVLVNHLAYMLQSLVKVEKRK